eukprot:406777-Prymnesium_polylepis.1
MESFLREFDETTGTQEGTVRPISTSRGTYMHQHANHVCGASVQNGLFVRGSAREHNVRLPPIPPRMSLRS